MKKVVFLLLSFLMLPAPSYAEKIYPPDEATHICQVYFDELLEGLDTLARRGATAQQLKDAIITLDPEVRKLLFVFIDMVMGGNTIEAHKTAELVLSTCSKKLQELDI